MKKEHINYICFGAGLGACVLGFGTFMLIKGLRHKKARGVSENTPYKNIAKYKMIPLEEENLVNTQGS